MIAVRPAPEAAIDTLADPRVKEKLQAVRQTDNVTNLYWLIRTWVYLALVIGLTVAFYEMRADWGLHWAWSIPVTILAVTLIGAGQHQLTGLSHEASHHILFKNRLANDLVSDYLCMFPIYSSTHHYRLQHLAHHQFVNDPAHDPDISQLQTSGHWLNFPVAKEMFIKMLVRQLGLIGLIRYMRIRAAYNAIPSDKNPYLKKGWKPRKTVIRVGILYLLTQAILMTTLTAADQPQALAIASGILYASMMAFLAVVPESWFHQSRVHPVISMRSMSMGRITFFTAVFGSLAALSWLTPYAALYYLLLWLVPIFTSFSFCMILRQLVQHGNGDRGWLTNTRVFKVHPFIRFAVFPLGQDYHLPHHLFASVPHFRLRELHEFLVGCREYREQAVEVEGYFFPYERPQTKPTVLDVVGPDFHHRAAEVYIDNAVLEDEKVEDKDDILRTGELEKAKRREEMSTARELPAPAASAAASPAESTPAATAS
jgi:fatty acid desaturase